MDSTQFQSRKKNYRSLIFIVSVAFLVLVLLFSKPVDDVLAGPSQSQNEPKSLFEIPAEQDVKSKLNPKLSEWYENLGTILNQVNEFIR